MVERKNKTFKTKEVGKCVTEQSQQTTMWLGNKKKKKYLAMKSLCNNQKEPRTNFFIIQAVIFFSEHQFICSINSFFGVISTSTKIVDQDDIAKQKNIKLKLNISLKSSAWKSSHFKVILQFALDSMVKFSLSGLSYDNFYCFQIFLFFIYGAF